MKKKRASAGVHWHIYISEHLSNKVELLLLDPLTGRTRYGAKGQLVEKLLTEYLRSQTSEASPTSPEVVDNSDEVL